MSGKSNFQSNKVLDTMVGGVAFSTNATLYFALFTTTPADDNTGGVEVSGNAYARASVSNDLTNFPAASGQSKSNANDVVFATASGGNWGTVVGGGVFDALTVGNLLFVNDLVTSKSVDDNDTARFPAGTLVWTED